MGKYCPTCRKRIEPGTAFCPRCGKALAGAKSPQAQPVLPVTVKKRAGTASWKDLKRLFWFYGLLLGCSLLLGLSERVKPGLLALIAFKAVWIVLVLWVLAAGWKKYAPLFQFQKPRIKTLLEVALACAAAVLFLKAYFGLFHYFGWDSIKVTEDYAKAGWPTWAILGMMSVEPGIFEEIAFRGIIQTRLALILSKQEALLVQAALFSILHLSPTIFVSHFVMGLLLGWVRLRSGNLYYGMILHIAWNGMLALAELGH